MHNFFEFDEYSSVILSNGSVAHLPVSVSVAVMCVWWTAAVCPEFPGLDCWPLTSSYTVYTKQCMYKIEKPGGRPERKTKKIDVLYQIL